MSSESSAAAAAAGAVSAVSAIGAGAGAGFGTAATTATGAGAGDDAAGADKGGDRFAGAEFRLVRATPLVMSRIGLGLAEVGDGAADLALAVLAESGGESQEVSVQSLMQGRAVTH